MQLTRRILTASLALFLWASPPAMGSGLVLSEVMLEPPKGFPLFVEIENASPVPADLRGLRIEGDVDYSFPGGAVLGGWSRWVVAGDAPLFRAAYGRPPDGEFGESLLGLRGNVTLRLVTAEGDSLNRMEVDVGSTSRARSGGSSLELRGPELDGLWEGAWAPSLLLGGTPGGANSVVRGVKPDTVVPARTRWRLWKGSAPPSADPLGWTAPDFDDASWISAQTPIGFGNDGDATTLTDMEGHYSTVYLRREFTYRPGEEGAGEAVLDSILTCTFDDGFVAYLNGVEIVRRNLGDPGTIVPHDGAASDRQRLEGVAEEFHLPGAARLYRLGKNLLAVQAANDHVRGSDFEIHPSLAILRGKRIEEMTLLNEIWTEGGRWYLELFHSGREPIDLGGFLLLSSEGGEALPLPSDLKLEPGGFAVVEINREILRGKTILADGERRRLLDSLRFAIPLAGGAAGRFPDGAGRARLLPMATPHERNAAPAPGAVVLSEIHYHPLSQKHEFLELFGREDLDLGGWRIDGAVHFTFAPGTRLRKGEFLAVANDPEAIRSRYGEVPVAGPYQGNLAQDSETITLIDPKEREIDRVRYADDGAWPAEADGEGPSLELLDPERENEEGAAWRASLVEGGTPGRANSVGGTAPLPLIRAIEHSPLLPRPREETTILASIEPSSARAELLHRLDGAEAWERVAMAFDGRRFRAVIPSRPEKSVVEYAVEAWIPPAPGSGEGESPPRAHSPPGAPGTFLFEVLDGEDSPLVPTFRLILRRKEIASLDDDPESDDLRPATFIAEGRAYQDARVRHRGHPPHHIGPRSYHVSFTDENPFQGETVIHLDANHPERQTMGMDLWRRAGMPYSRTRLVHLFLNDQFFPLYGQAEAIRKDYLQRHFAESGGNLYRGRQQGDFSYLGADPAPYVPFYEKRNNETAADWSDVIELARLFSQSSDADFPGAIGRLIDVEEWIDWFALNTLLSNHDAGLQRDAGDDYFLYHSRRRGFLLLPWNLHTGHRQSEEGIFRQTIPAIRRLLTHPAFAPRYYQRLARILELHAAPRDYERQVALVADFLDAESIDDFVAFAKEREAFVGRSIPRRLTAQLAEGGFATGPTLYADSDRPVLGGTAPVFDTARVLVNGREALYTPWRGTWSFPLALGPPAMLARITALDGAGAPIESRAVEIRRLPPGHQVLELPAGRSEWAAAGSPYLLADGFRIGKDSELLVQGGCEVIFPPGSAVSVEGTLRVMGSAASRVAFIPASFDGGAPRIHVVAGGKAEISFGDFAVEPGAVPPGTPAERLLVVEKGEARVSSCTFRGIPGGVLEVVDGSLEVSDSSFFHTGEAIHGLRSRVIALRNLIDSVEGDNDAIDLDEDAAGPPCECRLEENTILGGGDDGIDLLNSSAVVRGNTIDGTTDKGMSVEGPGHPVIEGNLIRSCADGIALKDGSEASGSRNTVTGCNTGLVLYVKNAGKAGPAGDFHSSILWGNGVDVAIDSDSRLSLDHSDIGAEPERWGAANLRGDPLFAEGSDYRLRPGSPCLSSGRDGGPMGARGAVATLPVRVERIDPPAGPAAGGIVILLEGEGLEGVLAVLVDGKPLREAALVSHGSLRGVLPAATRAGRAPLELVTPEGITALPDGFRYTKRLFRGDANGDLRVDLTDALAILEHLFRGGALAVCPDALDVDGDRKSDLTDAVSLLQYLFAGGPPPATLYLDCE